MSKPSPSHPALERDDETPQAQADEAPQAQPVTATDPEVAREQRDLNAIVHMLLIVGLIVSITLMLIGLGLALARGTGMPTTAPGLAEALRLARHGRPSGFLTLGLLVLIATPIMRVGGSIITFIYERDWRYALITTVVLMIVIASLFFSES